MKKILSGIIITTLMLSMVGCAPKETLKLNEKYAEYYDTKTNTPTKGIIIEYGETPSLEVKEYLSEEQSEEFLLNTVSTLHAIKYEEVVEEPMEVKDKLEVGDYYLVLAHEDNKIQLLVSVRDTKAPEFKDFKEELSYEEGTKDVDLKSLFSAEDLSETEVLIEGEVDFNKVGEYKITVIAKDLSDNETKKECTVKITKKPKQVFNTPSGGGSTSSGNSGGSSSGSGNSNTNTPSNGGGSYTPVADHYNYDYAQQVFNLINQERQKAGLSALPWDSSLEEIANIRSVEIVDDFSHRGFDKFNTDLHHGEIIADGYTTPQSVVNGWMNSKGHRDWIMGDNRTSMAASCYVTDDGSYYHWVVNFYYEY